MSDQGFKPVAFYDALREANVRVLDGVDQNCRAALLEQMVDALASVVVERAPAEAARLWRRAALDVRLRQPVARRQTFGDICRQASASGVWIFAVAFCAAIWGAVVASLLP